MPGIDKKDLTEEQIKGIKEAFKNAEEKGKAVWDKYEKDTAEYLQNQNQLPCQ